MQQLLLAITFNLLSIMESERVKILLIDAGVDLILYLHMYDIKYLIYILSSHRATKA